MDSTSLEQSVLSRPKPDRAQLVHLLPDSLDATWEADIQDIWLCWARRRADDIDAGKVKLVSSAELEMQVQLLFK